MKLCKLCSKIKTLFRKDNAIYNGDEMLNVYNAQGKNIFTVDDRLFKLIGYFDVKMGDFTYTIPENARGKLYIIPIQLIYDYIPTRNKYPNGNMKMHNVVYLKKLTMKNNIVSGRVERIFDFDNSKDTTNYYFRIFYGVM